MHMTLGGAGGAGEGGGEWCADGAYLPVTGHLLRKGSFRGVVLHLQHDRLTGPPHPVPTRPESLEEL